MSVCHCRICGGIDYTCAACPDGVLMDITDDGPVCPACGGTEWVTA